MGVALKEIIITHGTDLSELRGKTVVVDGFNTLYQFLSSIRQPDGAPFTDSCGNVTSHIIGLWSRTAHLLKAGLKLSFVFDGKAPRLKREEQERRKEIKTEAREKYEYAKSEGDIVEMKKYASRASTLTPTMVIDAQNLLEAMGIPFLTAPSEGEAQAAYMVKNGDAFAAVSQDYDSLLYGCPRLIQNLSITGRRKIGGRAGTVALEPTLINLSENLAHLGLTQHQLIALAMLVGTDYNRKGIKGIGPKKALALVKQYKEDYNTLFSSVGFSVQCGHEWKEIFSLFTDMPVLETYTLQWKRPSEERVLSLLVDKHQFSHERVAKQFKEILDSAGGASQRSLGEW